MSAPPLDINVEPSSSCIPESRLDTCYHEAGHAVIAWSLGMKFNCVKVFSDEELDANDPPVYRVGNANMTVGGQVLFDTNVYIPRYKVTKSTRGTIPHSRRTLALRTLRQDADAMLCVMAAGVVSQARYKNMPVTDFEISACGDGYHFSRILRSWYPNPTKRNLAGYLAGDRVNALMQLETTLQAINQVAFIIYHLADVMFDTVDDVCSDIFNCDRPTRSAVRSAWGDSLALMQDGLWPPIPRRRSSRAAIPRLRT